MLVGEKDIVTGLRALGIGPGARLMVHSSLKSFGTVRGGAEAVIAGLMKTVTREGTLVMPSFNHGAAFAQGQPGYFCPTSTPTTSGAIPDRFWRMPGVTRSLNPTHSFAAWGLNSERYTAHHHQTLTMGPESPLGLLMQDGGYGLLLGVGYSANTFHHVVEMSTGAPCLGLRTQSLRIRLPGGRLVEGRTWSYRSRPCPFNDGGPYGKAMQERGLESVTVVGSSQVILYRLQAGYELIAEALANGRDGLPPCNRCPIRPRRGPRTVASDWDQLQQLLVPESRSWSY